MTAQFLFLPLAALLAQGAPAKPAAPAAPAGPAVGYTTPIGMSIGVEAARKVAAAAAAEAKKNGWFMAIAVVDPGGALVYYEKADNTQMASATIAIQKAKSAALFKRPTKAFQDGLAKGAENLRILRLEGAVPVEGGVPLVVDGKLVGGLGVSGDMSEHDNQCATAGAATLTAK
jgi:glc operon protein GlcG